LKEPQINNQFAETIKSFSQGVFRLIYRIVHDREEALDLTQDVFVKILDNPSRIKDKTKMKAYIFKTAYHHALNARRNRQRHRAGDEYLKEEQSRLSNEPTDTLPEQEERQRTLKLALEKLPTRQKESLNFRFYGELTIVEIARAMGISEGSVKVHLARGLQNLRTRLAAVPKEEQI